jgi:hypothetical protein
MRLKVRPAQAIAVAGGVAALVGLVVAMMPALAAGNPQPHATAPGTITTIGGGLGGPASARAVGVSPCAVTYAGHALYVTDEANALPLGTEPTVVRKISTASGGLVTIAGTGTGVGAPQPDGSSAQSVALQDSCGVAIDHAGNVLVSDSTEYQDDEEGPPPYGIRVVAQATGKFYGREMAKGREYTLVKSSDPALRGDAPGAIAVDAAGNVLFTGDNDEIMARAVRTGTFYGVRMQAGRIYRIAGGGDSLKNGVLASQAGLAFIDPDHFQGIVDAGLRIDHHGNLVIADEFHGLIRVVAARNGTFYGQAMRTGHIYTIAGNQALDPGESRDGGLATQTGLFDPAQLAIDHQGNVLLDNGDWVEALAESSGTFYGRSMLRGHLYRIIGSTANPVGNGGPARQAGRLDAGALSVDGSGNVVIAQTPGLRVVPVRSGTFYGQRMKAMHIYAITFAQPNARTILDTGDGGPATQAELHVGQGLSGLSLKLLATDAHRDLFVADFRQVDMIAGASGTRFGRQVQAGHLYRIAGDGGLGLPTSGAVATSTAIDPDEGINADAAGNLLIADTDTRRVLAVAASTGTFYGRQMTAGHLYTVAGNGGFGETGDGRPALQASIGPVSGVAPDAAGDLLIATQCKLRVLAATTGTHYGQSMTAGDLYTIAGTATCSDSADGSVAASASLTQVGMVAVDSSGSVLFSDKSGIRVIAEATGTSYGQPMTAGDLYTAMHTLTNSGGFAVDSSGNIVVITDPVHISVVAEQDGTFYGVPMTAGQTFQIAGNGFTGHSGDGGPAIKAALDRPASVLAMADGSIVDAEYHWIRKIAG